MNGEEKSVGDDTTRDESESVGAISKNPISKNPISKNPISKNPISKNPISKNPISKNPISKNPISKNPISKNPISKGFDKFGYITPAIRGLQQTIVTTCLVTTGDGSSGPPQVADRAVLGPMSPTDFSSPS